MSARSLLCSVSVIIRQGDFMGDNYYLRLIYEEVQKLNTSFTSQLQLEQTILDNITAIKDWLSQNAGLLLTVAAVCCVGIFISHLIKGVFR